MRRDPIVPFLLAGVLLWGVHWAADRDVVHVSPELLGALAQDWEAANGTAPDPADLMVAAEAWLTDELRYREGLALGLDGGDPVVRRRVIQKVQALEAGLNPVEEPSVDALQAWLDAHADRYPVVQHVRFTHVFGRDDATVAERLAAGAEPGSVGVAFPHRYTGLVELDRAERELGSAVADALRQAPLGTWTAVQAAGWHAVRVDERPAPAPPTVAALRDVLTRDWRAEAERARDARAAAARRARVEVVWPR